MQINDLLIFQSVAEHGSFTKAAAATNTVQSNVTARIKFLESEFSTRLFDRTSRKIELTDDGIALLKTAKEILALVDNAKQNIGGVKQPLTVKGSIRIGCIHTTAALRAPGILNDFGRNYPEVTMRLKTGTTDALTKDVLNYKLDGAFVAGMVDDERLSARAVVTEELGIVASGLVGSAQELQSSGKPVKLIVFSDGCSYRRHFEKIIESWSNKKIVLIEHDTLEGILNAVEAGAGITLLPVQLIEKHYRFKSLKVLPLPEQTSRMTTFFITRKEQARNEAHRLFFETIANGYGL